MKERKETQRKAQSSKEKVFLFIIITNDGNKIKQKIHKKTNNETMKKKERAQRERKI
jgi:hypothetical protein